MSSPLSDVDTNVRHERLKLSGPSRIPDPPATRRTNSAGRRSPFSVSANGSPRLITTPVLRRNIISPAGISRIPRKSHTPPSIASQNNVKTKNHTSAYRSSLPRVICANDEHASIASVQLENKRPSPPSNRNKPLPSPPIAQVVDPNSPLKIQRTLVDAESGSPPEEEWPILRPENVSPPKRVSRFGQVQQRSVSEGATQYGNNTVPMEHKKTSLSDLSRSRYDKFRRMTEPRGLCSNNPYATHTFHAISTMTEVAMESPLARKVSDPSFIAVPPCISSKRSSLPLLVKDEFTSPIVKGSVSSRQNELASTKWPVLEGRLTENGGIPKPTMRAEHENANLIDGKGIVHELSLDQEPELDLDSSIRVKRLSWRASTPDQGPVLTIYGDADTVILGRDGSLPGVPELPYLHPHATPQNRSLSALAGRLSKRPFSKMTLDRKPTSASTTVSAKAITPVKITPIRSMLPPRTHRTDLSPISPSPSSITYRSSKGNCQLPSLSLSMNREILTASQTERVYESSSASEEDDLMPESRTSINKAERGNNNKPASIFHLPEKAEKVLGINRDVPNAVCKNSPPSWMSPTLSSSNKISTECRDTGSSLKSLGRLSNRVYTSSGAHKSDSSSVLRHSATPHSIMSAVGPTRLGASESATPASSRWAAHSLDSGTIEKEMKRVDRVKLSTSPNDATSMSPVGMKLDRCQEAPTKKIKIKRSLRNFFIKRNPKHSDEIPRINESKRSSMTANGTILAKRIRNSTNFSKVHLPNKSGPSDTPRICVEGSMQNSPSLIQGTERDATLVSPGAAYPTSAQADSTGVQYDTTSLINTIIGSVTTMPSKSPDRLRGLEIAEAVLHSFECFKEAKMSAEQARKHARDAELNADRAALELERLQKLCEPDFDRDTLQAINELVKSVETAGVRL